MFDVTLEGLLQVQCSCGVSCARHVKLKPRFAHMLTHVRHLCTLDEAETDQRVTSPHKTFGPNACSCTYEITKQSLIHVSDTGQTKHIYNWSAV